MDFLQTIPLTMSLVKAGTAAGTTSTFSASAITVAIRGKAYAVGAATNAATPTTDANTGAAFVTVPVGSGSVFLFCYDGSAAAATGIKVYQGTVQPLDQGVTDGSAASAKFAVQAPQLPVPKDNHCPFAYLVVKVGSSGTAFTFGTSNLSGTANVGYAWQDLITMPDRPQVV